jgi:hypothetical protein
VFLYAPWFHFVSRRVNKGKKGGFYL